MTRIGLSRRRGALSAVARFTVMLAVLAGLCAPAALADKFPPPYQAAADRWFPVGDRAFQGDAAAIKALEEAPDLVAAGRMDPVELGAVLFVQARLLAAKDPKDPKIPELLKASAGRFGFPLAYADLGYYVNAADLGVVGAQLFTGRQARGLLERAESTEARVWLLDRAIHYFQAALDSNPGDEERAEASRNLAEAQGQRGQLPARVFPDDADAQYRSRLARDAEAEVMEARIAADGRPPENPYIPYCGEEPAIMPANLADVYRLDGDGYNRAAASANGYLAWSKCYRDHYDTVAAAVSAMPGEDPFYLEGDGHDDLIPFLVEDKAGIETRMRQIVPKIRAARANSVYYDLARVAGLERYEAYSAAFKERLRQLQDMDAAEARKAAERASRLASARPHRRHDDSDDDVGSRYMEQMAQYRRCMYFAESYKSVSDQAWAEAAHRCEYMNPY